MKPGWDALAEKWADSILLADVDCTEGTGQELCDQLRIKQYPTYKYYNHRIPKWGLYTGDRDFHTLDRWITDNLLYGSFKKCRPTIAALKKESRQDRGDDDWNVRCSKNELEYLQKMVAKGKAGISKELERLENRGKTGETSNMSPERRNWIFERVELLKGLLSKGVKKEKKPLVPGNWERPKQMHEL
eukprot:gnl/MRDRNA2_/MRDRNA2_58966_c0_seq1.p1 gnl/MRDRNA2_/MRDRNA2_58966_c0~~gnl/MRDRNA2_/MRDRNA2_58966_c0_seq1.p1  ORF type:complete len:188 (-),score=28.21 gnl/MRDRNA2_/MRDRNA2_58966_c0_seq1:136-699(-)